MRAFRGIAQSLYISPPELSQIAAEAALGAHEELDGYKRAYAANRACLLERLPQIGFSIGLADGRRILRLCGCQPLSPMTAWPSPVGWLAEIDVAATPGFDFDPVEGPSHHALFLCGRGYRDGGGMNRIARWLA